MDAVVMHSGGVAMCDFNIPMPDFDRCVLVILASWAIMCLIGGGVGAVVLRWFRNRAEGPEHGKEGIPVFSIVCAAVALPLVGYVLQHRDLVVSMINGVVG